ncbi:hypothetical protein DB808_17070, partial [Xanthomonas perforans]
MIDSMRHAAVRPTCRAPSATSPNAVDMASARTAKPVRVAPARHVLARTLQRARACHRTNARQLCRPPRARSADALQRHH